MSFNASLFSSETPEWETPQAFFDHLNERWHFTLDVAATAQNAKCARYFTRETDGLAQNWGGERIWLNSPYGREIVNWVRKAVTEAAKPGTVVVMLLPARTDTSWWHDYVIPSADITFLRGRLKFGGAKNSAPFPSAIAVFGSYHDTQAGRP